MTFVTPVALAFLALLPIIVLFYVLRAQFERREVPSTWLWRNVIRDTEGRPSWRPPVRNLLLLLQVLVALAGALALARPALLGAHQTHHIILIDASLGMQAADVAPSRFDDAKRRAADLIRTAQASDKVTIVRVGSSVDVVESGPPGPQVLASLASLVVGSGGANGRAAMPVLTTLVSEHGDYVNQAVFFTDGALDEIPSIELRGGTLRFEIVGTSSDNQGIVSLRVRRSLDGGGRQEAFARIVNFADAPVELGLKAAVDGIPIETRRLRLAARASSELILPLPAAAKLLEVNLERNDILAADNYAQLVVSRDDIDVTLVSGDSTFMERALRAVPGTRVGVVKPAAYKPAQTQGLTVFDGFIPKEWPNGNVLIVNPVAAQGGIIEVGSEVRNAPMQRADLRSPLLDSVDLTGASLGRAQRLRLPPWASIVVDSHDTALILEGQTEGRKVVIFAFDPKQPDMAQRIAMPLMVANAVQSLAPSTGSLATSPGGVVLLPTLPDARDLTVRDPTGKLHSFAARGRPIPFAATTVVGRYLTVQRTNSGQSVQNWFVVNAGDELHSDVKPRQIAAPVAAPSTGIASGISFELWPILAALGLTLLAVEWYVYVRH